MNTTNSGRTERHPLLDFAILAVIGLLAVLVYNVIIRDKGDGLHAERPAELVQPRPTDAVALGNQFMDQGLYDHAIVQYKRALTVDSLQPDVMVDLGSCYHAIGDNQEALEYIRRALQQEPEHQIAWFNLGVVQLSRADTAAAKEAWNTYLEMAGNTPQAKMIRRQLNRL
jgi:tetratricopeptide (TPR) repeat protein